jgi:hypothetical protein
MPTDRIGLGSEGQVGRYLNSPKINMTVLHVFAISSLTMYDCLQVLNFCLLLYKSNPSHFVIFHFEQTSGAASYSKFMSREMSKAEALLKVCDH